MDESSISFNAVLVSCRGLSALLFLPQPLWQHVAAVLSGQSEPCTETLILHPTAIFIRAILGHFKQN